MGLWEKLTLQCKISVLERKIKLLEQEIKALTVAISILEHFIITNKFPDKKLFEPKGEKWAKE